MTKPLEPSDIAKLSGTDLKALLDATQKGDSKLTATQIFAGYEGLYRAGRACGIKVPPLTDFAPIVKALNK